MESTKPEKRGQEEEPKPEKKIQDWVTAFDRDLIRAARDRLKVEIETVEDEEPISGVYVIQVDKDFIKLSISGDSTWLNKAHICRVRISGI